MTALLTRPPTEPRQHLFQGALDACRRAHRPDRGLDMEIALALFPSLRELEPQEAGIWRQLDGSRVRALHYSSSWSAGGTIVPAGYWIETGPGGPRVCGASGDWDGLHSVKTIALCIAALGAQLGENSLDRP